jgi:sugar phosphate isomerase/epimerase
LLIVAADFSRDITADDYSRAAAALSESAALAEESGVHLALEFQKGSGFCSSLDTAVAIVAESGARNAGVCLDLFHYYTGPSKFEDLAHITPENLAWVQVCDLSGTPREVAGDRDRILPGEGDFQITPILEHLEHVGYDGFVSLEVLNPRLWQVPADRVADLGFQSLQRLLGPDRPQPHRARGGP